MQTLYFNPWNDLALASGDAHYTPPASALRMAADLADFPALWDVREEGVLPWGWSPLAVRLLAEAGVPTDVLPTTAQLAEYRAAASRETAVRLLHRLREECPEAFADGRLTGESRWCRTEAEVLEAHACYGRSMLKAPWSGSGRGVHPVGAVLTEKDQAWVRRTLARQGGVEVESYYNKVQDLAMEFWAEPRTGGGAAEGRLRYEGLSLFETTDGGVYAGNLVAQEEAKRARLEQWVRPAVLDDVCHRLLRLLAEEVPAWYRGPLGVDMMVVGHALHPLVEVNLRMTMGWVACRLTSRLAEGATGRFRIEHAEGRYRAIFTQNES